MGNIDRVCFSIGSVNIYWYGVLMASGIIVAILLANIEGKRKKLYSDAIIDLCLWIIPLGVIGARLYYVLFSWKNYAANPISALYIWQGGLAMYGSIIGGLIGLFIFSRRKKIRALKLLDCIAPGLVLAQAIGRWGNFFNQEAFGLPVTPEMMAQHPILQYFPFVVSINGAHSFDGALCLNPIHLATFFYESAWCVLVFILLWSIRKKFKHDGDCFLVYAMLYSFERMFVEGLRGDSLYLIKPEMLSAIPNGIRVSQALSLLLFVGIGVFLIIRTSKERKSGELIWPAPEADDEGTGSIEMACAEIASEETLHDGENDAIKPEDKDKANFDEEGAEEKKGTTEE